MEESKINMNTKSILEEERNFVGDERGRLVENLRIYRIIRRTTKIRKISTVNNET